jgi:hypothetical protein
MMTIGRSGRSVLFRATTLLAAAALVLVVGGALLLLRELTEEIRSHLPAARGEESGRAQGTQP